MLSRIAAHLALKEKPFRIVDLHAGPGLYDLGSEPALKTGEWQHGIGRLFGADLAADCLAPTAEELIAPWRAVVRQVNAGGELRRYPGSPFLAAWLLRSMDRLNANELHPDDAVALEALFVRDRRVAVTRLDALIAIKAQLPPVERRGLVVLDPPYERSDEVERLFAMLREGLARFASGIYLVWYPITGDHTGDALRDGLGSLGAARRLVAELVVRAPVREGGLAGSGVAVLNPPWRLADELSLLLPGLCEKLAQTADARWSLEREEA